MGVAENQRKNVGEGGIGLAGLKLLVSQKGFFLY